VNPDGTLKWRAPLGFFAPDGHDGGLAIGSTGSVYLTTVDDEGFKLVAFGPGIIPPSPVLSVTPSFLDFGNVPVGETSDLIFTVQNTGGGTLTGSTTTSAPFSIVGDNSFSLGADQMKTITVRFSPSSANLFIDVVNITSNGGNASLPVQGEGVPEQIIVGWTTPSPPSVTSGETFTVAWSITGAMTIDHVNVHWDPVDPTAIHDLLQ
jgi:hypothetical protein